MNLQDVRNYLSASFVERNAVVEGMITALVARQHVLLVGPPGTAKSALVMEMARCIDGAVYFQWLLTRFSTPEELFGPVSLAALEQGVYQRNTAGKLPEAHIAFVDEIFKANSAILNSLLSIINERLFYNNGSPVRVPLVSLFGASNEYPDEDENLEALYDRFLLRYEIAPVEEDGAFAQMLVGTFATPARINMAALEALQQAADQVAVPQDIIDILVQVRRELRAEEIVPSDRRMKQSLSLAKATAALYGRNVVEPHDLGILKDALWEKPEQKKAVAAIVIRHAVDEAARALDEIITEAREIRDNAVATADIDVGVEAHKKLKKLKEKMKSLEDKYPSKKTQINVHLLQIENLDEEVKQACLGI